MENLSFQCTALRGMNKVGLLKADASGYYPVVLGALDVFNSAGDFYTFEHAKRFFEDSSVLMRSVTAGALRGENGHPQRKPGVTDQQFMTRLMEVIPERVCVHIRRVWLDFENIRDRSGKRVIAIMGEVKPSGELGYVLKEALENPHENVAFSIRCFVRERLTYGGYKNKMMENIITWDFVTEPGIAVADKYYSPAMESANHALLASEEFTPTAVLGAYHEANQPGLVAMESTRLNFNELMNSLGWANTQAPVYTRW